MKLFYQNGYNGPTLQTLTDDSDRLIKSLCKMFGYRTTLLTMPNKTVVLCVTVSPISREERQQVARMVREAYGEKA